MNIDNNACLFSHDLVVALLDNDSNNVIYALITHNEANNAMNRTIDGYIKL